MEGLTLGTQRLVHLDLKGAPPKLSYLEKLAYLLLNCFDLQLLIMPFTSEQDSFIIMAHFRSGTRNADGLWSYSLQSCIEQFTDAFPDLNARMERSPHKSVANLAAQTGISYGTCQKALKKNLHMHPYKVSVVQQLYPHDYAQRVQYCQWFMESLNNDYLLDRTFMSDEAWFHLSGYVNSQNYRTWATENPHNYVFYKYVLQFFPFIKDIGATGLLIEWEDTFPYSRELIQIGGMSNSAQSTGAPYTIEEAKQLLDLAADCGLTVIPLVQTFGHLEYVLKHEQWQGLREVESYPSSICPSNSETMPLIRSMIKQIIAFHSNIQYIHIGADEVWHMGRCSCCLKRTQTSKHGIASIYLEHVSEVAQYIKENFPNLRIIIWDDMLRNINASILQEYCIGTLVEPMVWHYNNAETFNLGSVLLEKYNNIFANIWAASAFKGATSSCQILPINKHHISNHEAWLSILGLHGGKIINFRGLVLTGWSRFDHYATLCELLPCSIPTLCLCLKTWLLGGCSAEIYNSVGKMLGYVDIPLQTEVLQRPSGIASQLNFPGWQIMVGFDWFLNVKTKYRDFIQSDQINTWFNQWQVLNNYTNPMQIEAILPVAIDLHTEITSLENFLKVHLQNYFYSHTIEELIGTLVSPIKQHLRQLKCECETQISSGCRIRGHKRLSI